MTTLADSEIRNFTTPATPARAGPDPFDRSPFFWVHLGDQMYDVAKWWAL
jgi:hypothetical protein